MPFETAADARAAGGPGGPVRVGLLPGREVGLDLGEVEEPPRSPSARRSRPATAGRSRRRCRPRRGSSPSGSARCPAGTARLIVFFVNGPGLRPVNASTFARHEAARGLELGDRLALADLGHDRRPERRRRVERQLAVVRGVVAVAHPDADRERRAPWGPPAGRGSRRRARRGCRSWCRSCRRPGGDVLPS